MTESLNHHLATVVMGWSIQPESHAEYASYYDPKKHDQSLASDEQDYEVLVKNWNPPNNIKQAMGCYKALGNEYRLELSASGDRCFATLSVFGTQTEQKHKGSGESYEEAISLAVAKARGWEE